MHRERIVGSRADGLSVRRKIEAKSGGSSRIFSSELAASFMKSASLKYVNALLAFGGLVVNLANDVTHLIDFDQHLRWIGRNDGHVWMGLHQDAGFALVGVTQIFAYLDSFGKALFECVGLGDADAIRADTAEIRQTIGVRRLQTVHRFRDHLGQREFS